MTTLSLISLARRCICVPALALAACTMTPGTRQPATEDPLAEFGEDPSLTIQTAAGVPQLGVQQGPGCTGTSRIPQFAAWLGREPDLMLDFLDDRSWTHITQTEWWTNCWKAAGRRPVLSVPMLPRTGGYTLAQGAAGQFDQYYRTVAEKLVKAGYGDIVIRLGWEFNAEWFTWRAAADPASFVQYWRRIVAAMRRVPGENFKFDWSTAHGTRQINPELVYPGNAWVDIIGMDVYNVSWRYKTDPIARWNELMSAPHGLRWHADFAKARNKPMSFSEWATGTNTSDTGGGDDPFFIDQMAAWIRANNFAYHAYWDETASFNGKLSNGQYPQAGAAYRANFGPQSSYAVPAVTPLNTPTR